MKRETVHLLLVDDSESYAAQLSDCLEAKNIRAEVQLAPTLAEARRCLGRSAPDLIMAEWEVADGKALELFSAGLPCPLVVVTKHNSAPWAVASIKAGAWDYVVKSDDSLQAVPELVEKVVAEWDQAFYQPQEAPSLRRDGGMACGVERFQTFFETAAAGMVVVSLEGDFLQLNRALCRFIGYSADEMIKLKVADVTHPEDLAETEENYRLLRSGDVRSINCQKRFIRKDGSTVWGHVSVAAVLGASGRPQYYVGLVQDITESKRIQDLICESQQMLQLVLDYIPQYVFWKDVDSVFLGCNRNFAHIAGMKPQELIGKTDYDLPWHKEEADFYRECDRRVMAADQPELHIIEPQRQADGKEAWLDTNKIPLHDSQGNVVGILGTFEDITERKCAEEELRKTNRELDAFVYTVSHDLRTPLTPIIGYAEYLQEHCRQKLNESELCYLAKIESQARRMLAVMEDLLSLSRVGHVEPPKRAIDAGDVLDEVLLNMAEQIAETGVAVTRSAMPHLFIPPTLLSQLFDNLIGNALRYAGPEGGPIEVDCERKGELVQLAVRDHGPGIPETERGRIFELFYRCHSVAETVGTGVGLATVQKIARLYRGRAWVEETPGGGSTFIVQMHEP